MTVTSPAKAGNVLKQAKVKIVMAIMGRRFVDTESSFWQGNSSFSRETDNRMHQLNSFYFVLSPMPRVTNRGKRI
jgi:hypothetical protein